MLYPPERLGVHPQEKSIEVEKGIVIHGWYFSSTHGARQKAKGLIIFFHGNAQNLTSHYANLVWILKNGYDFFIWDYRGYGKSNGEPTPQNTVQDGIQIIKTLAQEDPQLPLIIFGQSLGGAIAMSAVIRLQHQIPIAAVVIDSSFASYKAAARSVLSQRWITWLFQPLTYIVLSDTYAPNGYIQEISPTPLLVMHGNLDQIIDYKLGMDIFKQAKEPKEFWTIENGQHIDSFWNHGKSYQEKFLKYLDKTLKD